MESCQSSHQKGSGATGIFKPPYRLSLALEAIEWTASKILSQQLDQESTGGRERDRMSFFTVHLLKVASNRGCDYYETLMLATSRQTGHHTLATKVELVHIISSVTMQQL